jgi:hypothetical protein
VVKRIGAQGKHFQFRQVRDALGVPAKQKNQANQAWNMLAEFQKDGIIEEVPGEKRKRHRYYRVADEEKLRQLLSSESSLSTNGAPRAVGVGPEGRITRMEGDIKAILDKLDTLDAKVSQLVAAWS